MPPQPQTPEYDKDRWMRALESLAHALGKDGPPVQLCLIGSAACIFSGMEFLTGIPAIRKIILSFPKPKREAAKKNLVYLEILQ